MFKNFIDKYKENVLIFLKNIGMHYVVAIGFLILIAYIDNTDVIRNKRILGVNLYMFIFFLVSLIYIIRYRPRDKKIDSLSDNNEYKRLIRFFRETFFSIFLLLIALTISSLITKDKNYFYICYIVLLIRFFVSSMMILTDLRLVQLILISIVAILISRIIGVFDIKWWAFISGSLLVWNYINSKDFLILLNKGFVVENIPPSLEFRWQKNRAVAYITTVIIYLTFIISSFYEKKDMDILAKAAIRVSVFGVILFILAIIYVLSQLIFDRWKLKKGMLLDNFFTQIGIKKYINMFYNYINLHKEVILDNNQKTERK